MCKTNFTTEETNRFVVLYTLILIAMFRDGLNPPATYRLAALDVWDSCSLRPKMLTRAGMFKVPLDCKATNW